MVRVRLRVEGCGAIGRGVEVAEGLGSPAGSIPLGHVTMVSHGG